MKTCSKCKESKPEECFAKKTKGKLQPWCKDCNKLYQKSHYKANKQKRVSQVNEYKKDRRLQLRQRLYQFLLENPCVDCGENDPVVLEFDHVRGQKTSDISSMIGQCSSWDRIQDEIAKCEVRCANCHRKQTAIRQGWKVQWQQAGVDFNVR